MSHFSFHINTPHEHNFWHSNMHNENFFFDTKYTVKVEDKTLRTIIIKIIYKSLSKVIIDVGVNIYSDMNLVQIT